MIFLPWQAIKAFKISFPNLITSLTVKDVLSKSLGSSTKVNMARATLNALKMQKSPSHVAALRGKTVEEILN